MLIKQLLVIRPAKYRNSSENLSVNIDDYIIIVGQRIKKLGGIFDSCLTFQSYIKAITKTACFHEIWSMLSLSDAETLIYACASPRHDNCHVLLSGLPACVPRSLQLRQNAAARILTKTPILASLHWLPVQARADFKVLLLNSKAFHGIAKPY